MRTRRCINCEETHPIERFPPGSSGKRSNVCDELYCVEYRRIGHWAFNQALCLLLWPVPLVAIAIIVFSLLALPVWWLFIPLALWAVWKLRRIRARVQWEFDNMPEEVTARLDKLHWLRGIQRELWRMETVVTPGLAEFFSELRDMEDLNPQDREAVLKANDAQMKRARAAREEGVKDLFDHTADGDGMTCG